MILDGKVTVITGGGRGLGRDLAALFLRDGAKVVVCDKMTEPVASSESESGGDRWHSAWYSLDLAVPTEVEAFAASLLATYGHIDILVNNAGYGGRLAPLWETTTEEFERHVALHLVTPFLLIRNLLPSMLPLDEAWIVNIASQAGKRAVPKLAAYSATKFALVGMAQALTKELKDTNVSCVTVCPGGMATEMRASLFGWEDAARQQSTASVARLIRDVVTAAIPVARGAEVLIRQGRIQRIELSPDY